MKGIIILLTVMVSMLTACLEQTIPNATDTSATNNENNNVVTKHTENENGNVHLSSAQPSNSPTPFDDESEWLGTWIWNKTTKNDMSTIKIQSIKDGKVLFSLNAYHVTNPNTGDGHHGELTDETAVLNGKEALFKDKNSSFQLQMTMKDHQLIVSTNGKDSPFGAFVEIDGHYSKELNATSKNVNAGDIKNLIPNGWRVLEKIEGEPMQAKGDLNKDGIDDLAIVIEAEKVRKDEAPSRALLIAFGNGDKQYSLSIIADKAILKSDQGGVWVDPLEGISVDRGSVVIRFYGGSNFRWYSRYRFRFQDNDWYLIGATIGSNYTGNMTSKEEDYNLLTGDYVIKETDESNNSKTTKGKKEKPNFLRLKDFIADADGGKEQLLR